MPESRRVRRVLRRALVVLAGAVAVPARSATPLTDGVEAPRRVLESRAAAVPDVDTLAPDDLLRRGLRDVGDALATLPGVQVVETVDGRRALMVDGWLQRALWCVDGRPVMRTPGGQLDLGELPSSLEEVARVELIRRPMSHVYGAGAEAGVLNLVTRRLQATGVSATAAGRVLPGGGVGGAASGHAAHAGERGGVYGHGSVMTAPGVTTLGGGDGARRRVMGGAVGGAFRLHPRVLVRADASVRQVRMELDGGPARGFTSFQRAAAGAEMVVRMQGQDTLRLELRLQGVESERALSSAGTQVLRGAEQQIVARYVGEPVAGHQLQAEVGVLGEAASETGGYGVARQRLRAHAFAGDTWRLSRVFALEGGIRVEATDRLQPAAAPILALRYEPFRNLHVRASAAAGYRYTPLRPDLDEIPAAASMPDGRRLDPEYSRQARFSVTWQPDTRLLVMGEVFRSDLAGPGLPVQVGALTAGLAFGQFSSADSVAAHTQGVRTQMSARRLVGGVRVDAGYAWLQEAMDDVTGKRLPYAARHHVTLRSAWEPSWLGMGLEAAVEALMDRVDVSGRTLPPQGMVHVGAWRNAGPLQLGCMLDNAFHAVESQAGPREGRSARCLVRLAP